MIRSLLPFALLLLAGCTTSRPAAPPPPPTGESARYVCADGRQIEVLYAGDGSAVVTVGDQAVELHRTSAAEGEHYAGGGLTWVPAGPREGRLGATAGPAAGTTCRVG